MTQNSEHYRCSFTGSRKYINDIIVYLWYTILPVISLVSKAYLSLEPKFYFDILIILISFLSIYIIVTKHRLRHWKLFILFASFLLIFIIVWLLKQYNFFHIAAWSREQYIGTFIREIKPLFYFASATLFISAFRLPSLLSYLHGGIFLSFLIILDVLIKIISYGEIQRPSISDEANYENFLILISLISLFLVKPRKFLPIFILFLFVTLLSQSRTGILSFFILSCIYLMFDSKSGLKSRASLLLLSIIFFPIAMYVFEHRFENIENIWQADRFRMLAVFYDYIADAKIPQIIFGQPPGSSLLDYDSRIDWFIHNQSEKIGAFGVHPFNLHGFHARFISSWGIFLYAYFVYILYVTSSKLRMAFNYIFSFFIIQGFSLGIIYLSIDSFIFIIFLCSIYYMRPVEPGQQSAWS